VLDAAREAIFLGTFAAQAHTLDAMSPDGRDERRLALLIVLFVAVILVLSATG
jgi:hypothetical protein